MRKLFSKKFLSVLLASSMVIGSASALTGCGSKKNEVIKLNVYSQLANFSGKQIGWSADILKKKFNVELNIIPEGDGVFETRMTSGNLGDIVVWGADNDKYPLAVKNNLLFGWEDDNVLDEYGPYIKKNMPDALKKADEVLQQAVQGITDLINVPGLINLDFADIQTVMIDKGIAHIGIGKAKGDDKAIEAVKQAVSSPLLETTIEGASHVIINISGDISLIEANDAASYVQELAGDDANIIFGAMYDENAQDEASITVIATGLDEHNATSSVSKVMSGLNSYKAQPAEKSASNEAAATETAAPTFTKPAQPAFNRTFTPNTQQTTGYTIPKFNATPTFNAGNAGSQPAEKPAAPAQERTTPSFRPAANKEMQINIPDFLKNKR